VVWDCRDEKGIAVPAGAYVVEIYAVSPDGQAARHTVPLIVVR
jgi:hypothetical protein